MAEENDSVLSQLNKDFPSEEELDKTGDVFGTGEQEPSAKEEPTEELPDDLKNRHIRRLEAKLAREREANIELAAREAVRSEVEKFSEATKGLTIDESLLTLYGDNENGRKAAQITQALLDKTAARAKEDALSEFNKAQESVSREVAENGNLIDERLEEIEDTYSVDLSGSTESSKQTRNSFLALVAKLSPKDAEGNIESYADFDSTWELFQERQQKTNVRNKDLASRGMVRSAAPTEGKVLTTEQEKWLRDQGII